MFTALKIAEALPPKPSRLAAQRAWDRNRQVDPSTGGRTGGQWDRDAGGTKKGRIWPPAGTSPLGAGNQAQKNEGQARRLKG